MKADLVVQNARIVLPETGPLAADLVVKDGRVIELARPDKACPATQVLDVGGRVLLPGLIDPHVHPGWLPPLPDRMKAESAFGVSGGITTFIRYLRRPESYLDFVDELIDLSNRVQYQDYAVHLTLYNRQQVSEISRYVERFGITSFKVYMNPRGRLGRGTMMDLLPNSNSTDHCDIEFTVGHLNDVFRAAAGVPARVRVNVHCEDGEILYHEIERVRRMGLEGLAAWHHACPDISEALAITQVAQLSRAYGVPTYFPHIGSKAAIQALMEARDRGTDFVAETCAHYLTQTTESEAGVLAKVMPPLRNADDRNRVWQAIRDGLIETIGSDHVAYTLSEKNPEDIWAARPGFGGTGLILPLLLSAGVNQGRMSLQQLAEITSYNTARAFGLYPRKGTLLPGSEADFVIVDQDKPWRVAAKELFSASDFSIYEGMELTGAVKSVYVRGTRVFEDGKLCIDEGHGKYLSRSG